jgi:amino acid transporter/nucleotide-binding universal stress UspA family protein
MSTSDGAVPSTGRRLVRAAQVIVVSSVMFTFISYWRTAAVVLCDLASTAYYIGGIVEQAIGPAAPWFILAVMLFSYAVRSVYLESCSMFVRGGVYKVVKEAMGGFLAKLSVSALMFDYVLTGPISGVSACQYLVGLILDTIAYVNPDLTISNYQTKSHVINWSSAALACLITLYFFRQNLLGIHESSDKALKIMFATTVMAAVILSWSCLTLAVRGRAHVNPDGTGARNSMPLAPDLNPHNDYISSSDPEHPEKTDPLGFISNTGLGQRLRDMAPPPAEGAAQTNAAPDGGNNAAAGPSAPNWLSVIGLIGIFIAFGHSILAMSGEETLAQVYREVESPKMKNFKKAAFIVFVYSLVLTAGISFLAVLLVPENVRMKVYNSNLISGLAMNVIGPEWARLLLNAFVVVVGFLILAGAVNTAIIGSNGVLNRVAEDGVLPDWFLKPHPRYGTTYRILYLILLLQLATIIYSGGDVILLGEAYAFGVVWSFVFKAAAMVVLRFTEPGPREFKVPLNIHWRKYEVPIGLSLIFLVLLTAAMMNLLTKKRATIWGGSFTAVFLAVFVASEQYRERRRRGGKHEHLEQFNRQQTEEISRESLRLAKPYRKLVAIRSPHNLYMLEKSLAETDPVTTDVVVLTAKVSPPGGETRASSVDLDNYDQHLMTAVVDRAERAGKPVVPLIVPTNNPLHAVLKSAQDLQVQELVMGASNKYTADEQLEQIGFYWISLHQGEPVPLTVRILSRDRDVALDLAGGNRIPKITERQARSVAELRAAGVGVDRVLLLHDGSPASSDLFQAVLTMLDPQVSLALIPVVPQGNEPYNGHGTIHQDEERARKLGRELSVADAGDGSGPDLVRAAQEGQFDLIVLPLPAEPAAGQKSRLDERAAYLLDHAHCRVFLAAAPPIPQETDR